METKTNKKQLQGVVVSDKADKTITVLVKRFIQVPKYKKFMKVSKKYRAHDGQNKHQVGDLVTIEECKPMSKDKHFRVIN